MKDTLTRFAQPRPCEPRGTASRDRIIIHADVNGHFAYSSLIYRPDLLDVPVVIGGNEEARHGIVLSKNQAAKPFRIQTGSSLMQARQLCPNLKSLPPNYDLYTRTSQDFYHFMDKFTDITAPFGCDGISLDVTGSAHLFGGVENIVREIHRRFPREYGLNLSIGISWNFPLAKLACDTAGPNGVKWIMRESPEDTAWQSIVYPMPVEELIYIGEATRNKFWSKGVRSIGDLVECGPEVLKSWMGKLGVVHYIYATGQDVAPIAAADGGPPMRSVGNGSTTPYDITREEDVHNMVHVLSSSVCQRMRAHKVVPKTVEVAVTYTAPDREMHYLSWQCAMPVPSSIDVEFAGVALRLLEKNFNLRHPIRKLSVRGKDVMFNVDVYQTTLEMNAARRERSMALMACKDEINARWEHAVRRGVELADMRLSGLGSKANQQFAPAGWY